MSSDVMADAPQRPIPSPRSSASRSGRPFLGLIDAVVVESPVEFSFDGAVTVDDAQAAWNWLVRDVAPDLIDIEAVDDDPRNAAALESLMPDLLARASAALAEAKRNPDADRRIHGALGG